MARLSLTELISQPSVFMTFVLAWCVMTEQFLLDELTLFCQTFIPQDAALFSGTLRDNLDPFGRVSSGFALVLRT